ncbi:hypothetical protein M5K25_020473 [Dendrobium thyrsiflorum]|uniref:Uncharacterized protein n=1 Tax=Dendrobium thyrsiflorum TaxID=117978 RepID=A0ABD0U9Z5_DENTH
MDDDYFNCFINSIFMVSPTFSTDKCSVSSVNSPEEEQVAAATAGLNDRELRLVHLLKAAAESLTGAQKSWELARVILVRLKELIDEAAAASGGGGSATSIERLAIYLTNSLQNLLDGAGKSHFLPHHPSDVASAFQLLQDMSPLMSFGYFTANQAILEAVAGERHVHIVDYDIMEGVQWASLIQAFVSRNHGAPPPYLVITAISRSTENRGHPTLMCASAVQQTGRRLADFAASVKQPFSFSHCRLDRTGGFRPAGVKVVKGEAVAFNCFIKRSSSAVGSFLASAGELGARLVTVIYEEEGRGEEEKGFVARFMGEMERQLALLEALEEGFPKQKRARDIVERLIFGPRIEEAVARAYFTWKEDEEEEEGRWTEMMAPAGFEALELSSFSHSQARLLISLYNEGYRIEEDGKNKLVLSWKSRRLLSSSAWGAQPRQLVVAEIGTS